jgi:hypothetical protein
MSLTVEELRDLYTTRPDRFVQVRNDLVRTLKKAGRRDDADDLATRRPSVACRVVVESSCARDARFDR